MSIKKAALVAVAAATCSLVPLAATPAQAAPRHCAKKSDFHKVHHGQSMKKVRHELHSKGHKYAKATSHGYRDEVRVYRTCRDNSAVAVGFLAKPGHGYHVEAKRAVWG